MPVDFVNTYVPAFVELTPEEVADCRTRLETLSRTMFPELDTAPSTVLGDLILTPQAYQIAALEKGLERFMSDLDLANVAKDEIYNCDFVAAYIKNFSTDPSSSLRSSGVIRLVFSENKEYVLDRGVQFRLNDFVFSIYAPNTGSFNIYKVGNAVPVGVNGTVLRDSGSEAYFADIPVVGHDAEVEVLRGTEGLISVQIPELGSIAALIDFNSGATNASLPQLAERTRSTIYAASLNTRNGAIRYVEDNCPFVESVYAIRSGDDEMLRGYNSSGVSSPCLDVFARSKSYAFVEEQTVQLAYDSTKDSFEGKFNYTGQPYYIDSVTHQGVESPNLSHSITAVNTDSLGARGSYTQSEELYLTVPDQKDTDGASKFNPYHTDSGALVADFVVRYHTDPLLPSIAATVGNSDYTPVNVDVLVRGFIPVVISKFNVKYVRKPGVVPDLETAEQEIRSYLDGVGAPDVYADSEIARIMSEAGVKYTAGIDVYAKVQWTLGDYITPVGTSSISQIVPAKNNTVITTSAGLRVKYPNSGVKGPDSMYACSVRNIRYYMLDTAVSFTEVKEM